MKLKIFVATLFAALTILSSCKLDNGVNEISFSAASAQIVVPDDESKEVKGQSQLDYSVKVDLQNKNITINSAGLQIGALTGDFASNTTKYQFSMTESGDAYLFRDGGGMFATSRDVTDLTGFVIGSAYGYMPVFSYKTGNNTVKVFPDSPIFYGTTKTSYTMGPAGEKSFETTDPTYALVFNKEMTKAKIIIYSVKFAQEMPALDALTLEDLNVELTRDGYIVTGEDVIPKVRESDGLTEYPNFPFKTIELKSVSADLAGVECRYEVNAKRGEAVMVYNGEFAGRCAPLFNLGAGNN